jgi:ATP-dependent Clp protease ATP-binding subunit ClpC
MNDSTLIQLKILIERAVRPVRASLSHKRKVREELLAHVSAVFEEEAGRAGDDRLALEQTAQRFGNPAELTGQLQESVPANDRMLRFLEQLFVGGGESGLRHALRITLLVLLFPGAFLLAAFFVQGRMAEWPTVIAGAVLAFVGVFLGDELRDALFGPRGRSWRKAVLVGAASWFLVPGVTFALCLIFSGDVRASLMDVLPVLPAALLTPAALIGPAYVFAVDARSQQEWASLSIG